MMIIMIQERLLGLISRGKRLEMNYIIDYGTVTFKYKEMPLEIM